MHARPRLVGRSRSVLLDHLGVGDAGAPRDDDGQSRVRDLVADDARVLGLLRGQRRNDADVLARHAETCHQVDQLLVGGHRRLAARHRDDAVVEDEDLDVHVLAGGIEQRRHAGMGERAVADHAERRTMPACAAPMAMPIDAPMHTHEWIAWYG